MEEFGVICIYLFFKGIFVFMCLVFLRVINGFFKLVDSKVIFLFSCELRYMSFMLLVEYILFFSKKWFRYNNCYGEVDSLIVYISFLLV